MAPGCVSVTNLWPFLAKAFIDVRIFNLQVNWNERNFSSSTGGESNVYTSGV